MDRHTGQRLFCGFRNIFFQYGVEVQVNFSRFLVVAVAHHGSQFAKGHGGARRIQVLAVVAQRPARQRVPLGHRCRIGSGQRNIAAGQAVGFRQIIQVIVHKMDRHAGQRLFCGFLGFRRFFRDLLHLNVHYTVCININFFVRVGQFIPHRHGNACLLKQIGHHDPIVSLYLNAGFCPIVKILATSAVSDMEHKIDHVRFFLRKRVQRQTADRHEDGDQHGQQAVQTTRLLHMITPFS